MGMLTRPVGNTTWFGITNSLESRNETQIELDRMDKWSQSNWKKHNRDKCKYIYLQHQKSDRQVEDGEYSLDVYKRRQNNYQSGMLNLDSCTEQGLDGLKDPFLFYNSVR